MLLLHKDDEGEVRHFLFYSRVVYTAVAMKDFQYVDIHTHVNLVAFKDDQDEVTRRALSAGVAHINVGTQRDTSQVAVALAEEYEEGRYAAVGLHPVHT